jgi:SpoVK/Ycf46/Vps4 family AAA+-type ATPase
MNIPIKFTLALPLFMWFASFATLTNTMENGRPAKDSTAQSTKAYATCTLKTLSNKARIRAERRERKKLMRPEKRKPTTEIEPKNLEEELEDAFQNVTLLSTLSVDVRRTTDPSVYQSPPYCDSSDEEKELYFHIFFC